ncbi:MAG: nucleotidyltransferase domain-containing protein [Treponema sp.]|jgi:predicted nucleotidyltransferase|nr:nucleotidyltransferase domain-containing protein [Treponema sp.]
MKYGLSGAVLSVLNDLFRKHEGIQKVVLYGSRAMDNYRQGSDIDITLITGGDFRLEELFDLKGELDESSLPYLFDVSLFGRLKNENLLSHINRVGKVIYEKEGCCCVH